MDVLINGKPGWVSRQSHKVVGVATLPISVNGKRVQAKVVGPRNVTNPYTGEVERLPSSTVFEWNGRRYYFRGDARNMGFVVSIEKFNEDGDV